MRTADEINVLLDPDIREMLAATPFTPINAKNLEAARVNRYAAVDPASLSANVTRETIMIPGPDGAPEIALRVHRPAGIDGPLPCLYWMHGGGMVMGNHEQDDLRFDRWCAQHSIVAVSVDYRLAPETQFPGPIEDCYAGLVWIAEHAAELGINQARIGIGGASAGGGLAAALALLAKERGGPAIASQLLIYPMIDDRMITASSSWEVPIWPPSSNLFGWGAYLGDRRASHDLPVWAAAARAEDLVGLPTTLIVVGALDGFVDEDVDYAARLNRAGVETELHVYPGAPHGFDALLPRSAVARRCDADMAAWVAKHYAH